MTTALLDRPDLVELLDAAHAVVTSASARAYCDPYSTYPGNGIARLDRLFHAVATIPELSDDAFEALIPGLRDDAFEAIARRRLARYRVLSQHDERRAGCV